MRTQNWARRRTATLAAMLYGAAAIGCLAVMPGVAAAQGQGYSPYSYPYGAAAYGNRATAAAPAGYARAGCGCATGCASPGCVTPYTGGGVDMGDGTGGTPMGTDAATADAVPDFGSLASTSGYTAGTESSQAGLGMIGDLFSGGAQVSLPSVFGGAEDDLSIGIGGGDRRGKVFVDHNTPIPMNRVYFSYHHFSNALTPANSRSFAQDSQSLDRYLFGWEWAKYNGLVSGEIRIPFAYGLDDIQSTAIGANNAATEFGNVSLAGKLLLWRGERTAVSIGTAVILPTADDTLITDPQLGNVLLVKNDAVHVQPFLGMQFLPTPRTWVTVLSQLDFDTTGNQFDFITGNGPGIDGVLQDQALGFIDVSTGFWIYRDPSRLFAGVAPIAELHYTTTLEDSDFVRGGADSAGDFNNRVDVLNMTGGLRLQFFSNSYLTVGGVAPLRTFNAGDKQFDAEVTVQYTLVGY